MSAARRLLLLALTATVGLAFASPAQAQSTGDGVNVETRGLQMGNDGSGTGIGATGDQLGLHSIDGLEEMAQPGPITLPPVLGTANVGVTVPLDRRFEVGGETMWRAGYQISEGFYLGGGFGMVVTPGGPFRALPEGTLTQFQGLISLDWVMPLRPSPDPYGLAPALRVSLAPGFIGGDYDPSRSEKEQLSELDQHLDTSIWGGVVRLEAGFDLPILELDSRSLFLSFGLTYQWGMAQANYKLRDRTGANPSITDEEVLRLDSFSAWLGFTVRF